MLSRNADSLYWMSRYLERAEHTARLIDVNLHLMLDSLPGSVGQRWNRLLASLRTSVTAESATVGQDIPRSLTFDRSNPDAIIRCVEAARENARQIREQISTEMWEQLNKLYLQVRPAAAEDLWNSQPHEFFRSVVQGAQTFQGITDSTLSHGEGWHFIQVGRFIERAAATASLLDVHAQVFLKGPDFPQSPENHLEWAGLLKSCTAFEAYCKVYTANLRPDRIMEFILLNADFPHSVRFSVDAMQAALRSISDSTAARRAGRLNRFSGRLCAALSYSQIDEVLSDDLHTYLSTIQRQCNQIHEALHQVYVAYPIEAAIAS
jgi:uncharacterized alpha-E superfamily protein